MKKVVLSILVIMSILPVFTKADGIPWPPITPYISEEHQIVLIQQRSNEVVTTLDLSIKNKPANIFTILEESIYINEYDNPVWIKTFLLPDDFDSEDLCINSYDFRYYKDNIPQVEVTINDNVVYLYTKGASYCKFTSNQDLSDPKFVNVSEFFKPGEYNTIEIRINSGYGFTIDGIYLKSGEGNNKVKIIIPFKEMPKSIEIGGQGIPIWELEDIFRDKRVWYGYYEGRLLSAKDMPEVAGEAQQIETNVKSVVTRTEVSKDVSGKFEGKVSDLLTTVSTKGSSDKEFIVVRFSDVSYEAYLDFNAYVIELTVEPFELKRIVIKWIEEIDNENDFDYYYPLGTGKTWNENIPYTAIYVKLPKKNGIRFSSVEGKEEVVRDDFRYYRWKFVESKPDKDIYITVNKLSGIEDLIHKVDVWIERNSMIGVIVLFLIIIGLLITFKPKKRSRKWI